MSSRYRVSGLFVDDQQLAKLLNLPKADSAFFKFNEDKGSFPKREADFGDRRYWRAVVAWFDAEFGLDRTDLTDARFMTEGEIAQALDMPAQSFKELLPKLIDAGFPPADIRFFNRRYWPAVRAWLDRRYNLIPGAPQLGVDGDEKWEKPTSASRRRS